MTPDQEPIIEGIRIALRQQGWTQRGLASAIGVKESLLSKTLTGRREMRVNELAAITEVLNISVDALLRRSGKAVD